jgi:hypothetical protein
MLLDPVSRRRTIAQFPAEPIQFSWERRHCFPRLGAAVQIRHLLWVLARVEQSPLVHSRAAKGDNIPGNDSSFLKSFRIPSPCSSSRGRFGLQSGIARCVILNRVRYTMPGPDMVHSGQPILEVVLPEAGKHKKRRTERCNA